MKNVLLLSIILFLSCNCFSQTEQFEDEVVIRLQNHNGVQVIATATKIPGVGKWYPSQCEDPNAIVLGDEFEMIESSNKFHKPTQTYGGTIIFDAEGDQNPDKLLSLSVYKITFSGNRISTFYLDLLTSAYSVKDREFTFDYEQDILYRGACVECILERIYPTDIINVYDVQETELLEDFWNHSLSVINEPEYPLKVHWGKHPDFSNPTKYKVYRAEGDAALQSLTYIWVGETTSLEFTYTDNAIIADELYSNVYSYYVTAANNYGESSPSNAVGILGRENWSTGLSMTTQGSNPRLVWVPYDGFSPTGYKIYRSINYSGGGPGTFGLLATTTDQGTVWIDQDLAVGSPWKVYYKVKAYRNTPSYQESDFTNIAETGGSAFMKQSTEKEILSYTLSRNYPNPFNPSTIINYQIKDAGNVDMRVYNSMGEEIAVLVNEFRSPGSYSVRFDGSGMSSGVYFYRIQTEAGILVRQMLLLK